MTHKATSLTHIKWCYVNTTVCLHQSIEGKLFITNTEKTFEKYSRCFVTKKGRNSRRSPHARSYTHACKYPTKDKRFKFYVVFKR